MAANRRSYCCIINTLLQYLNLVCFGNNILSGKFKLFFSIFDFGNSFPTTIPAAGSPNGPGLPFPDPQPADLGTLQAAIVSNGDGILLGTIDNSAAAYQSMASIQEFPLTADQLALAQKGQLVVVQESSSGFMALLAEDQNATFLTVAPRVHRLGISPSIRMISSPCRTRRFSASTAFAPSSRFAAGWARR